MDPLQTPERRNTAHTLTLLAFWAAWTLLLGDQAVQALRGDFPTWVLTDWLTSYGGGFVRRGLAGAVLHRAAVGFGISPYPIVVGLSFALYVGLTIVFVRRAAAWGRIGDAGTLALILLLPSLLLLPLLADKGLGRKELMFFIPLLVNLALVGRLMGARSYATAPAPHGPDAYAVDRYLRTVFLAYNGLTVPMTLVHESTLFLSLPVNAVITWRVASTTLPGVRAVRRVALIYLPTLATVGLMFFWRGDGAVAREICRSWMEVGALPACPEVLPGALQAMGWPFVMNTKFSLRVLKPERWGELARWLVLIPAHLTVAIWIGRRVVGRTVGRWHPGDPQRVPARFILWYMTLPLMASLPLYALGLDWGRWLAAILTSFMLCALTPGLVALETVAAGRGRMGIPLPRRAADLLETAGRVHEGVVSGIGRSAHRWMWPARTAAAYLVLATVLPICCLTVGNLYQGTAGRVVQLAWALFTELWFRIA